MQLEAYIWTWIVLASTIAGWIIPFVMLFVVPTGRKPSSATAWLLFMFAVPWLGLLLFLLIGFPRLSPRRRALQRESDDSIVAFINQARQDPQLAPLVDPPLSERYAPLVRLSSAVGAMPALGCNRVQLITDYEAILAQLAADIEAAQLFVHIQFYILIADHATEGCFQAMERAVARGIPVRVLYDPVGSRKYPPYRTTIERMRVAGIQAYPMLPLWRWDDLNRPDLRNHRKIVVVDGEIAYTGSLNLIERGYHRKDNIYYDELMARVEGPAADALDAVFRTDWFSETGEALTAQPDPIHPIVLTPVGSTLCQVLPSGSAFENENNLKLFVALMYTAHERIVICNPYYVPDESLQMAVISAATRGVKVTMYNSAAQDQFLVANAQRSYYDELLAAGVEIRLYHAPNLLHTKTISIDNDIAVIGSSNLDMRSFQLNLEVSLVCYDPAVVTDLRRAEEEYYAHSFPLDYATWQQRPVSARLAENIARLMSALL